MIAKEIDFKNANHRFTKAGLDAEKQMAFYLRRAFEHEMNIFILNDIRIELNGEYAQIDHLVIHKYGFIIIESKSISDRIVVNSQEEWKRCHKDKEKGIPSPIQQAKRQASLLKSFLNEKGLHLFKKQIFDFLIPKVSFDNFQFDILVSISDSGIIERNKVKLKELLKADMIPDKINELIARSKINIAKNVFNPFEKDKYILMITAEKKIVDFLCNQHRPKNKIIINKERKNEPVIIRKIEKYQPKKELVLHNIDEGREIIIAQKKEKLQACADIDILEYELSKLSKMSEFYDLVTALEELKDIQNDIVTMHYKDEVIEIKKELLELRNIFKGFKISSVVNTIIREAEEKSKILHRNTNAPIHMKGKIDDELFLTLKLWRNKKAKEKQFPAYCILYNKTLEDIAESKPLTHNGLIEIHGIGEAKLKEYGDEILYIIKNNDTQMKNAS